MPNKKPKTSMTIEPMPSAPKSFTDKNLDTRYLPQPIPAKGGSISPERNATPDMGGKFGHRKMTSLKKGGTAQYTGPHLLHKGEKVVPNKTEIIMTDPQHAIQKNLRSKADILEKSGDTSPKAAQFRAAADARDAYEAHGANGNMVKSKSSAIAPHDKGR